MYRTGDALAPLVTRLRAIASLTDADMAALLSLPYSIRVAHAGWEVAREGDTPTQCCLVIDGTFCRFKMAAHGARQMVSYHIRGDVPDLQSCFLDNMDHSLVALTPGAVAFIPHQAVRQLLLDHPLFVAKLLRESFIDSSISREWLCNVGRREAEARIAHLLCEMYTRHRAAGSANQFSFPFGLTQSAIGDSQGLSTVHVNRILQKLKKDGLIRADRTSMTILDWPALQKVGDFDRGYLHLREAA